jgi:hypothetical protein
MKDKGEESKNGKRRRKKKKRTATRARLKVMKTK